MALKLFFILATIFYIFNGASAIKGGVVDKKLYPYVAGLFYKGEYVGVVSNLGPHWGVTAAQNIFGPIGANAGNFAQLIKNPDVLNDFSLNYGYYDICQDNMCRHISEIKLPDYFIFPNNTDKLIDHSLALVKYKEPMKQIKAFKLPACDCDFPCEPVTIFGYGGDDYAQNKSCCKLQKTLVSVVDCYGPLAELDNSKVVCLGGDGAGMCTGDRGCPVTIVPDDYLPNSHEPLVLWGVGVYLNDIDQDCGCASAYIRTSKYCHFLGTARGLHYH